MRFGRMTRRFEESSMRTVSDVLERHGIVLTEAEKKLLVVGADEELLVGLLLLPCDCYLLIIFCYLGTIRFGRYYGGCSTRVGEYCKRKGKLRSWRF
jgi:hypothetical protein